MIFPPSPNQRAPQKLRELESRRALRTFLYWARFLQTLDPNCAFSVSKPLKNRAKFSDPQKDRVFVFGKLATQSLNLKKTWCSESKDPVTFVGSENG